MGFMHLGDPSYSMTILCDFQMHLRKEKLGLVPRGVFNIARQSWLRSRHFVVDITMIGKLQCSQLFQFIGHWARWGFLCTDCWNAMLDREFESFFTGTQTMSFMSLGCKAE